MVPAPFCAETDENFDLCVLVPGIPLKKKEEGSIIISWLRETGATPVRARRRKHRKKTAYILAVKDEPSLEETLRRPLL